ncbi:MAG TPA: metallophosphoesterase family protein [Caldilineaceae bacterium]|nr:metallophosphoesterase family protein [Caldilineaceae bacterium]
MQIAIFSDSHDQIAHLEQALAAANAAGAAVLLHCGDLCAPFMLDRLGRHFAGPIHVVFGNNDGDGRLLQTIAAKHPQITLHGIYAELTLEGRNVALIHYPEPARRIAQSGHFDLVCYGHNHLKAVEPVGKGVLANPGELLGMQGPPTWGLYDTTTGEFSLQTLTP